MNINYLAITMNSVKHIYNNLFKTDNRSLIKTYL